MNTQIREPRQKRSIAKKEKIIDAGWRLISTNGYLGTNTKEIAKEAGVSTGIVYQYFADKHDILIAGISKYGDDIFFPVIPNELEDLTPDHFISIIENMISSYIEDHKISQQVHEEIMAMVHLDPDIAKYYYEREMFLTNTLFEKMIQNGFPKTNLMEKVHIMIGMIDHLCHEVVYHKHHDLDYSEMQKCVIQQIENMMLK